MFTGIDYRYMIFVRLSPYSVVTFSVLKHKTSVHKTVFYNQSQFQISRRPIVIAVKLETLGCVDFAS